MQKINFKLKSFNSVSKSASSTIYSRSPSLQADHNNPPNNPSQSDESHVQPRDECFCYPELSSNRNSQEYQSLQSLEEYVSLSSTTSTAISTDNHSRSSSNAQANTSSGLNSRLGETSTCYASAASNTLIVLKSPTYIRTSSGLQVSENYPFTYATYDSLMNVPPLDKVSLNCCEKCSKYDLLSDDTHKICLQITYREEKFDVHGLSYEGKSHKQMFDLIDASMQTNSQSQMYVLSDSSMQERSHSRTFDVDDSKKENLNVNNGKADIKLDDAPVDISRRQDEIEELKKQLARMELEMQQKFQHNNEMVKELRDDLNNAVFKVTNFALVSCLCEDVNSHSLGSATKGTPILTFYSLELTKYHQQSITLYG
ncbi:hypothetical protein GQX74_008378 [Glossina fuscipes]|nr:hypothetical protein GQX74_008378 [Glossina fuscipes]